MVLKTVLVACINSHCHPVCLPPDDIKLDQGESRGEATLKYGGLSSITLILELHVLLLMKLYLNSKLHIEIQQIFKGVPPMYRELS